MKTRFAKTRIPKTILVPCDFSDCSRAALDYAAVVSKAFDSKVVLLHVIEPVRPSFLTEGSISRETQGRIRNRAGQELAAWVKRTEDGPRFGRPLVKSGRSWEVIVEFARKTAADLIVMGTHGYTGAKHAIIGSVAERVVQHSSCPVLTVGAKSSR